MTEQSPYAEINPLAVASLVLGIVCGFAILYPVLWIVGGAAKVLGILAIGETWRYSHVGRAMARWGVSLPCLFAVVAIGIGYFQELAMLKKFQSESSPGYLRVDFEEAVRPKPKETSSKIDFVYEVGGQPTKPESNLPVDGLKQHVGKRICLKGYSGPSSSMRLSGSFLLTADGRGGDGAVVVNLESTMYYSDHPLAVSGTLIEIPEKRRPSPSVKYQLFKPEIRYSITPFQLAKYQSPYSGC